MSTPKKIHLICAARPNFMKIAPLYHALLNTEWTKPVIVHTGQHYDSNMSDRFFQDLKLPMPDFNLNVGSGTHAEQTASVMMAYEALVNQERPDLTVVVGDVNSTLAVSIAAKKCHLKVAHLEAGLRCYDNTMPEEINRTLTDAISDILWTPSKDADANLKKEGIPAQKINCVGNIMIDSYALFEKAIQKAETDKRFNLEPNQYAVLTLHRPNNVDDPITLKKILHKMNTLDIPLVFPVHPRTQKQIERLNLILKRTLKLVEPMGYVEFMSLVKNAKYVITDSGGLQEETTYLGIPCFTLRPSTERPITVTEGSNTLVTLDNLLDNLAKPKKGRIPALWDGQAAVRIVEHLSAMNFE